MADEEHQIAIPGLIIPHPATIVPAIGITLFSFFLLHSLSFLIPLLLKHTSNASPTCPRSRSPRSFSPGSCSPSACSCSPCSSSSLYLFFCLMKSSYTAFSLGLQLQKQECERMYFVGRWVMHRIVTSFCCAILQVQKTAECERKRDVSSTTLSNPLTHSLSLSTWMMPLGC